MSVTQTGSSFAKDDGTGTTHDLVVTVPADAQFMRVSVSATAMPAITSVTHDQGGTNQACSRPPGMGAVLENGNGTLLDEYNRISPTVGASKTVRVVFASAIDGPVIGVTFYTGVDTADAVEGFESFVTPGPGDDSPTDLPAVSSAVGDLVVETCGMRFDDFPNYVVDGSQTVEVAEADTLFGGGAIRSSHKDGAASVTMQYTFPNPGHYCMLGYSIKATGGVAAGLPFITTVGAKRI